MPEMPPLWFGASSGSADLTKVFLDRRFWDKVMDGRAGQFLRGLTPGKALTAKAALLFASAFVKWNLRKNTMTQTFFQEVLGDFASEILCRWDASPMESLSSILNLDQKQLTEYLEWYGKQDEATQRQSAYAWRDQLVESLTR